MITGERINGKEQIQKQQACFAGKAEDWGSEKQQKHVTGCLTTSATP
jgi:hypothetical protein